MRRSFSVIPPANIESAVSNGNGTHASTQDESILRVLYSATTPRMLRVATNGFFESLGVVLGTMEELDVDVLSLPGKESVQGAQGIEALDNER